MSAVGGSGSQSFTAKVQLPNRMVLRYGSRVPYGLFLEYGTKRVKKRPFIAPTLEKFRPKLPQIFAVAFRRRFAKGKA